ncbi:unnamed protein product [Acanthoscelides obtectus]|uniref:Uncharacterized protein n=1 Tax=Acanthoscelides obtectus TaxID=200917 RepID=A0A9P0LA56_ACAOB|nr:unnamed protein product [Acanthoscelides obtectus]CAK1684289.1 hypothetical protein AOBTE_LOCUS34780 [Acanthoscelides obtectus]
MYLYDLILPLLLYCSNMFYYFMFSYFSNSISPPSIPQQLRLRVLRHPSVPRRTLWPRRGGPSMGLGREAVPAAAARASLCRYSTPPPKAVARHSSFSDCPTQVGHGHAHGQAADAAGATRQGAAQQTRVHRGLGFNECIQYDPRA